MSWHNKPKQQEAFNKDISKELMPAAWHPTRQWDWCLSKDVKKEIKPIFTAKVGKW